MIIVINNKNYLVSYSNQVRTFHTNINMLLGTKNSEIFYKLLGKMSENFTIDSITGKVSPREAIDFENIKNTSNESVVAFQMTIRAQDNGTPSLYSDVPFVVYVEDVNDNAPSFSQPFYNISIPETIQSGTAVLKVCKSILIFFIILEL